MAEQQPSCIDEAAAPSRIHDAAQLMVEVSEPLEQNFVDLGGESF